MRSHECPSITEIGSVKPKIGTTEGWTFGVLRLRRGGGAKALRRVRSAQGGGGEERREAKGHGATLAPVL